MNLVALGQRVPQPDTPSSAILEGVPRALGRQALGGVEAHFFGADLWHAYELSWLNRRGKPQVAVGRISLPADSPRLIESKSMKLFLNALNFSRFASGQEFAALLASALSEVAGAQVTVELQAPEAAEPVWRPLPGTCLDALDLELTDAAFTPSPEVLALAPPEAREAQPAEETLYSHLLRSTCPITAQPDWGSVVVRYRGPRIDRRALLHYIVSFRRHSGFHENLVERIFADVRARCAPERLTVWAQYTRRGGLDINPFRSDFEAPHTFGAAFRQ